MTDQDFSSYCNGRYASVMGYYDSRAKKNQIAHRFSSIYVLIVSVAITPILTAGIFPKEVGTIIAAILAPTVAIVTGISAHYQFHENWLSYRATWDAFRHERYWRDAQVDEYRNVEDRNSLFVERVEALISQEGADWLKRHTHKEKNAENAAMKAQAGKAAGRG